MEKVILDIHKGKGDIIKGKDSFIGKLLSGAKHVRIHRPGVTGEVAINKEAAKPKVSKPRAKKPK